MTAINIVCQKQRAIILTDTAAYDREGIVQAFGTKAAVMPLQNAAIATRGAIALPSMMALALGLKFETFDEMVAGAGDAMRTFYDESFYQFSNTETECEIYLVGWSDERQRFAAFEIMSEYSPSLGGRDPWTAYPIDEDAITFCPCPEDDELERQGFPSDWTVEGFDPIRHGLPVMEAQRQMTGGATSGEQDGELHLVGGSVMLTEVTREGTSQRIIRNWNDRIGETIKPKVHSIAPSLTRQQRRAMERQARKIPA